MTFTINWQLTGDLGNGSPPSSGTVTADAVERISIVVAGSSTESVATAVTDTATLRLLVVSLSRYADVTLKVGGGPAVTPTGPAIIDGTWAYLLGAAAPAAILVTNTGGDDLVVELLISRAA